MACFTDILLIHYQRYPLMQIDDFVKLIYQMIYGPKHFSGDPSLDKIRQYLIDEICEIAVLQHDAFIESIGHDFVRLHLDQSFLLPEKLEDVSLMFYQSMNMESEHPHLREAKFIDLINVFLELVKEKTIHLDESFCRCWIKSYIEGGIKPISHSLLYKNAYHPHYRVIHQSMLKK